MDKDMTCQLVTLVTKQQELARQIEQLEILKQKQQIDEQILELKEAMRKAVEDGTLRTGKQTAQIGNDELAILPKNGKTSIEVVDIDALDSAYRMDRIVEDAIVLEDGTIYEKVVSDRFYTEGDIVKEKVANEALIKNTVKLGSAIPAGVLVKKGRPSISITLNGKSL